MHIIIFVQRLKALYMHAYAKKTQIIISAHKYSYIFTHIYICIHAFMLFFSHTCLHAQKSTDTHACTHTRTHTKGYNRLIHSTNIITKKYIIMFIELRF